MITTADAIDYGFTGPLLRSTGAPRDLRKDTPYLAYAELDFEIPVGIKGDNYDRYYVRMREMDESVHMIRQLVASSATEGQGRSTSMTAAARCRREELVYREIESLINHFKLIMDGPQVPAGEIYCRARGRQRRTRLLPGQRWQWHAVQGARALADIRAHGRGVQDARRLSAGGPDPDLRLDQHDRRGVRQMSAAWPLQRRSALQAAWSRDATALRAVQADAGRLGAAALSPLGGTEAESATCPAACRTADAQRRRAAP